MEGFELKEHFDAVKKRDTLIKMIKEFTDNAGIKRVVLGISGGKDSSVAAALCARALGRENVYGIMLPDGEQKDISDSVTICESLRINARTVNIGEMHNALKEAVLPHLSEDFFADGEASSRAEHESNINVGPRLRMTTLRYIAQSLGAFLCGTGNLSEATVGYCTKDGDTSCDFNPLGRLTSKEVAAVGLTMDELPKELVNKAPTDGLSGMTDEEKLGITYQAIHDYIRKGTSGDEKTDELILKKYRGSAHKRRMPSVFDAFSERVI